MAQSRDFSAKRGSNLTANTSDAQLFQAADGSGNVQVFIPAGVKAFKVRAGGGMTAGSATTNYTPSIYWGNATTTVLATNSTVQVIGASSGTWFIEATCMLDVTAGKVYGTRKGFQGNTPTAVSEAVFTAVACTTQAAMNGKALAVTATWSTADAANVAKLDFFTLEVLELTK